MQGHVNCIIIHMSAGHGNALKDQTVPYLQHIRDVASMADHLAHVASLSSVAVCGSTTVTLEAQPAAATDACCLFAGGELS